MASRFETYLDAHREFLDALMADVVAAEKELAQADTLFNRRTYIRTVFALIEGDTFQRKYLALMRHTEVQETFSEAELALLREEQYSLTKKGEARTARKFLSLPDNLRFSFRALAKALGSDYELEVSGHGWESFRKALNIRNRLMHPKDVSDLEVTGEDVRHAQTAAAWYRKSSLELAESGLSR